MLEQFKESLGEAFTDELQEELEGKIDALIESKASMLADEKIEEETLRLNDLCESYKNQIKEDAIQYVDGQLEKLNNIIEKFIDKTVNDFVLEHNDTFEVTEADYKANIILDSLANACTIAGVSAQKIAESACAANNEQVISENAKMMRALAAMQKLEEEKSNLLKENQKLIKMGIIAELKEGLVGEDAAKFERCANNVPFEKSKKYINKLENLKESILAESKIAEECKKEAEDLEEEEDIEVSEEFMPQRVPMKTPTRDDSIQSSKAESLNESKNSEFSSRLRRLF